MFCEGRRKCNGPHIFNTAHESRLLDRLEAHACWQCQCAVKRRSRFPTRRLTASGIIKRKRAMAVILIMTITMLGYRTVIAFIEQRVIVTTTVDITECGHGGWKSKS